MEHSWEKQRRPMAFNRIHRRALHHRYSGNDADASSISGKYKHISLRTYVPVNDLIMNEGKKRRSELNRCFYFLLE